MGGPLDATEAWAEALRALWKAAGNPTSDTIARQCAAQIPPVKVKSSSWSDWRNGKNVPSDERTARTLVAVLTSLARRKTPSFEPPRADWWEKAWRLARQERAGKGGRPSTRHPPAPEVAVERIWEGRAPRPADCFQERQVAARVAEAADDEGTAVLTQVLAGMGGVGKTQLAAAYTREAWDGGVGVVVWADASTRTGIVTAYARAAVRLGLPQASRDDPEQAAEEFLTWAETGSDRSWLVVLDDVHRPADLNGLWPPADLAPGGRAVVTTRLREAALTGTGRRIIDIGTFTPDEARSYLTAKLPAHATDPADLAELDGLAGDLGFLPLALAQAAAYILNADIGVRKYRSRIGTRLLDQLVPSPDSLPDDHRRIVAAAWELSIDQADKQYPPGLARPLLHLASVLDSAGIPQAVLASEPALAYLAGHEPPGLVSTETANDETVDEALRVLHRYSLIDHDRTARYQEVRVHQLVQRSTRENLPTRPDRYTQLVLAAADALLAENTETQEFRSNARALVGHAPDALWLPEAHRLLDRLGESYSTSSQYLTAAAYYREVADAGERLGVERRSFLEWRESAAHCRGQAQDFVAADAELTWVLEELIELLGPDDPKIPQTRNNLAYWRGCIDPARALETLNDVREEKRRILGKNDPSTLNVDHHTAFWIAQTGDLSGAITLLTDLLAVQEAVLGPDDPATHTTWHDRAARRAQAGDIEGALTDFLELLPRRTERIGPDKRETLVTRSQIADLTGRSGDAQAAADAFDRLVSDYERFLGPLNRSTIEARHRHAHWAGTAHGADTAVSLLEELVELLERHLEPGSAFTETARTDLRSWQARANPGQDITDLG